MKKIIAGNWKLNLNLSDSKSLLTNINSFLEKNNPSSTVIVFPQVNLSSILANEYGSKNSIIKIGVQNISNQESGAFTGEISSNGLTQLGYSYALIGHSERRHVFFEKNESMKQRINLALKSGLSVVYCVGETLEEREKGSMEQVLQNQVEQCMDFISENLIIAYEPVWAIGTGKTATCEQAKEAHQMIRQIITKKTDQNTANNIPILYGGSVNVSNALELLNTQSVNGLLIGGASLKSEDFCKIIAMAG